MLPMNYKECRRQYNTVWNHKEKMAFKHTNRIKHQMPTSTSKKHQGKWWPQTTSLILCVRGGKQWRPGDTRWLGMSILRDYFWKKIVLNIFFPTYIQKHFFFYMACMAQVKLDTLLNILYILNKTTYKLNIYRRLWTGVMIVIKQQIDCIASISLCFTRQTSIL